MAFNWGAFAGGMAKTWNPQAIGGATNQYIATKREEQAVQDAQGRRDKALQELDTSRNATQEANKGIQVSEAIPSDSSGVDAVSGAAPKAEAISDNEYAARRRAIESNYQNDKAQARIDYYKFRGQDDKRMAAEDKLANDKWHQGFVEQYYKIMDGDEAATDKLIGFMNATSYDGSQIVRNQDGTMSLMGKDGKPIQANFRPTQEQINSAFTNYYNTAKFFHDGDMKSYLDNAAASQKLDLNKREAIRQDATLAENTRHNKASEGLTASAQAETALHNRNTEQNTVRGQTLAHVAAMAANETARQNNEANRALKMAELGQKQEAANKVKFTPQKMDNGTVQMVGSDGSMGARIDENGRFLPDGMSPEAFDAALGEAKNAGVGLSVNERGEAVYTVSGAPGVGFRTLDQAKKAQKQVQKEAKQKKTAIKTPEQVKAARKVGEKDAVGKWKDGVRRRFVAQSENPVGGD